MSSLDLLVDVGGTLYVRDPDTGRLLNTLSGAQDGWGDWSDVGGGMYPSDAPSFDASSYEPSFDASLYNPPVDPSVYANYPADAPPGPGPAGAIGVPQSARPPGLSPSLYQQLLGAGLGTAGPLAGLIGALAGQRGNNPPMSTAQKALGTQGQQSLGMLNPFIQGTSPLQMQQNALLQALASGTPTPGLQNLVNQAYDPAFQNLWGQASEAGRRAGFYDAPATAPPGGAILGPGLAQLQGQKAGSLLDIMQRIPGLFQQPIDLQANAAGAQATGYNNLFRAYPQSPAATQQPTGQMVGQGIGNIFQGAAQGFGQVENQQQQQNFQNSLLAAMARQNQGAINPLSQTNYS